MEAISWKEGLTPVSTQFDDIYFAHEDGFEESQFIFLDRNRIAERLEETDLLRIAELGFGTGLNFLATWRELVKSSCQKLLYLSVEKFLLQKDDLEKALSRWPELTPMVQELSQVWGTLKPGWNKIEFLGGRIELHLFQGDVSEFKKKFDLFEQSQASRPLQVDAWYLDGFSPRKNPEMWSEETLNAVGKHTSRGGSFSTFAAAGHVRRKLEAAGFEVERKSGFGRKRESLTGIKR